MIRVSARKFNDQKGLVLNTFDPGGSWISKSENYTFIETRAAPWRKLLPPARRAKVSTQWDTTASIGINEHFQVFFADNFDLGVFDSEIVRHS